jgi:2-amino-4-hydroxy-6-hydroxymethyldihydropteridine diphosphokinase
MILIGLGGNLASDLGSPRDTLTEALRRLEAGGVRVLARSPWYRTAPVPISDQPWYVNAVASVATDLSPARLLRLLHEIEAALGRMRGAPGAARTCDLDILAYDDRLSGPGEAFVLPHPRLHERAFVLLPLRDVAPGWRHPRLGLSVEALIAALPPGHDAVKDDDPP